MLTASSASSLNARNARAANPVLLRHRLSSGHPSAAAEPRPLRALPLPGTRGKLRARHRPLRATLPAFRLAVPSGRKKGRISGRKTQETRTAGVSLAPRPPRTGSMRSRRKPRRFVRYPASSESPFRAPKNRLSGPLCPGRPLFRPLPRCSLQCVCGLPAGDDGPAAGIRLTLRGRKIKGLRLLAVPSGSGSRRRGTPCSFQSTPAPPPGLRGLKGRAKAPKLRGPGARVGSCGPAPRLRGPASGPFSAVPSGVKTAALPALFPPETVELSGLSGYALPPYPPAESPPAARYFCGPSRQRCSEKCGPRPSPAHGERPFQPRFPRGRGSFSFFPALRASSSSGSGPSPRFSPGLRHPPEAHGRPFRISPSFHP